MAREAACLIRTSVERSPFLTQAGGHRIDRIRVGQVCLRVDPRPPLPQFGAMRILPNEGRHTVVINPDGRHRWQHRWIERSIPVRLPDVSTTAFIVGFHTGPYLHAHWLAWQPANVILLEGHLLCLAPRNWLAIFTAVA